MKVTLHDWCEKCSEFSPILCDSIDTQTGHIEQKITCKNRHTCLNATGQYLKHSKDSNWTPVENGFPVSFEVLVTILDETGDTPYKYVTEGCYYASYNVWVVDGELRNDIIAWCPMPKPYEKKEE